MSKSPPKRSSSPPNETREGDEEGLSPLKSPKKDVTRYGPVREAQGKFGNEERFMWQKANNQSDCAYVLPDMITTRSVIFGSSLRAGMDDNPDNKKRSTGPGSYNPGESYDFNSEYVMKQGNRFPCAPRQSMAVKTPSPGAVYNIEGCYYNGPESKQSIGFVNAKRQPLYGSVCTANTDMFVPKSESGVSITIAKKFKASKLTTGSTPGAIYNDPRNFQTGPKYSFGKERSDRFKHAGFLPELD